MPLTVDASWLAPDETTGRTPAQDFLGGLKAAHRELSLILRRVSIDRLEDGSSLTGTQRTKLRERANAVLAQLERHVTTPPR